VEQIKLAEEVKITKEKIKEVEEEWQNNLLNWKSKRRQSKSNSEGNYYYYFTAFLFTLIDSENNSISHSFYCIQLTHSCKKSFDNYIFLIMNGLSHTCSQLTFRPFFSKTILSFDLIRLALFFIEN